MGLQLHHVLKDWSGFAGYKYFNTAELDELVNPTPKRVVNLTDNDPFAAHIESMWISIVIKDAKRRWVMNKVGVLTARPRKIQMSMKLAGGQFFKCPQPNGNKAYVWRNLSEEEQRKIENFMQSWTPGVEALEYELNLHRRFRWSEHVMTNYAEWIQLVGL
ncbi:hypothetical protein EAF04_001076 [Stromatinia cepivora]|nr:hypothetical protein EAF04_001076 [Stromatinia cepivora]